jgi:hypothetical protein
LSKTAFGSLLASLSLADLEVLSGSKFRSLVDGLCDAELDRLGALRSSRERTSQLNEKLQVSRLAMLNDSEAESLASTLFRTPLLRLHWDAAQHPTESAPPIPKIMITVTTPDRTTFQPDLSIGYRETGHARRPSQNSQPGSSSRDRPSKDPTPAGESVQPDGSTGSHKPGQARRPSQNSQPSSSSKGRPSKNSTPPGGSPRSSSSSSSCSGSSVVSARPDTLPICGGRFRVTHDSLLHMAWECL